jgi:antitoxin component YwqK of YwqJK toxin-antitoxin module
MSAVGRQNGPPQEQHDAHRAHRREQKLINLIRSGGVRVGFLLALLGALQGCSPRVLDFRNAEVSNGKVYASGDNKPFTGKVTNVPENMILSRREGFDAFKAWVRVALPIGPVHALVGSASSMCDVSAEEGYVDGTAVCKKPGGDAVKYEVDFKAGNLHGKAVLYDLSDSRRVVARASFDAGQPQGAMEVIGPRSQKVVGKSHWEKGKLEGPAEYFNDDGGALVGRAEYRAGKIHGDQIRYSNDGKQVLYKAKAADGALDGTVETFYPDGKLKERTNWSAGKQHGLQEAWNEAGVLTSRNLYQNGAWIRYGVPEVGPVAGAPLGPELEACIWAWTAAHRRQIGPDAAIKADQIDEWKGMCLEGKRAPG